MLGGVQATPAATAARQLASVMAGRCINTFVAIDLETTGLPWLEHNKTKITELAMVAVSRENILNTRFGIPRVAHKLTVCLNPYRMINPAATNITGLSNEMLEKEKTFDKDACDLINMFLSRQIPPVCLVAHNGMKFDFPIIQAEIMNADKLLPDDILCIDSYIAFRYVFSTIPLQMLPLYTQKRNASNYLHKCKETEISNTNGNSSVIAEDRSFMQQINEVTPERSRLLDTSPPDVLKTVKAKRRLFGDDSDLQQLESFKLQDIYKFLTGRNVTDCHRAENDSLTLIACITMAGTHFMEWADVNAVPFNTVQKMR